MKEKEKISFFLSTFNYSTSCVETPTLMVTLRLKWRQGSFFFGFTLKKSQDRKKTKKGSDWWEE